MRPVIPVDQRLGPDEQLRIEMSEALRDQGRMTQVTDDIWVYDDVPISAAGMPIPIRMTIIRLGDGSLLLHSPTRYSQAVASQLEKFGRIKFLLAPNIAHWMFIKGWQKALPHTTTFAPPGLADRAQVREAGLRIDR